MREGVASHIDKDTLRSADDVSSEVADNFRIHSHDTKYKDMWGNFSERPTDFFLPENLQALETLGPYERLILLARASLHVVVTTRHAKAFFARFPSAIKDVEALLRDRNFSARDGLELQLFTLCYGFLSQDFQPDVTKRVSEKTQIDFKKEQYVEVWHRRMRPDAYLLSNYSQAIYKNIAAFGLAAKDYMRVVQKAHEMENSFGGSEPLETNGVFSNKDFLALSGAEKTAFLRFALCEMQFSFVFQETFNSAFTKENVEADNIQHTVEAQRVQHEKREKYMQQALSSAGERYAPRPFSLDLVRHTVAHSILFESEQPISVYSAPQSTYQREMSSTADIGGAVEEYPYHKIVLEILRAFTHEHAEVNANTDLLVEFWIKNQNPIFGNAVADALSKQNPERAAQLLMRELQNPARKNKNALAAILYRLELGQIAISREGAQYLGRLYDLGEYNNPNFFVRRLTATGTMGIFNEDTHLVRLFDIGDITTPERRIRADMLDLTAEMLFGETSMNQNGDDTLMREKLMKDFAYEYFSFYGSTFYEKTGIAYNNLSLREQGWFLHFMHGYSHDNEKQKRVLQQASMHGEIFLKVFLGVQYDKSVGEQILTFAEKTKDAQLVKQTFTVFLDLLQHAESAEDYIAKVFGKVEGGAGNHLRASVIASALGLFKHAAEEGREAQLRTLITALRNAPKIMLARSSKEMRKAGVLTRETVHNIGAFVPLVLRGPGLDDDTRVALRHTQRERYEHRPGGYDSLVDVVTEAGTRAIPVWQKFDMALDAAMHDAHSTFYLLVPPKETELPVASFVRFDHKADGVYMASVMSALPDSGAGELHAQAAFEKEKKVALANESRHAQRVYAITNRAGGITQKYHEWGFVTTGLTTVGDIPFFTIEWREDRNKLLTTTADIMSQEEVVRRAKKHAGGSGDPICYRIHTPPKADGTTQVDEAEFDLLRDGYVMTRYFINPTDGLQYAVFEKSS